MDDVEFEKELMRLRVQVESELEEATLETPEPLAGISDARIIERLRQRFPDFDQNWGRAELSRAERVMSRARRDRPATSLA